MGRSDHGLVEQSEFDRLIDEAQFYGGRYFRLIAKTDDRRFNVTKRNQPRRASQIPWSVSAVPTNTSGSRATRLLGGMTCNAKFGFSHSVCSLPAAAASIRGRAAASQLPAASQLRVASQLPVGSQVPAGNPWRPFSMAFRLLLAVHLLMRQLVFRSTRQVLSLTVLQKT